jgi:hypothetical protein
VCWSKEEVMWGIGRGSTAEPLLCDDLGDLEGCMGVDEVKSRGLSSSSFLPSAMKKTMQIAQEKMRNLTKKQQQPVESSLTINHIGSAEWCGLPTASGAECTPTQLAAAQWANKSLKKNLERSESASVTSAAETVHNDSEREQEREPVSFIVHTVSSFDNMSGLCLKYDMSVEELLVMNRPATRTSLLARKTIKIPIFEQQDVAARQAGGDEKGGGSGVEGGGGGGTLTGRIELTWECGLCGGGEAGNSGRVKGEGGVVHAGVRGRALFEESGYGGRGREEEEDRPSLSLSLASPPSLPSFVSSSLSAAPPPPALASAGALPSHARTLAPWAEPAVTPSSLRLPSF